MKIKRFIDCYVPVTTCTLRCHYCYITVHRQFDGPLPTFRYSPQQVRTALSQKRLGGICLINLCAGGETLLTPAITDYIRAFLEEGHYVMVVTNGTVTPRFQELASLPQELRDHLFFKFSYHFLELRKRGLTERFFQNIRMMRDAGCSFTLEITPSDELIPYIPEVKEESIRNVGALPHITIARDERDPAQLPILTQLPHDEYQKVWGAFESEMFRFKSKIFGVKQKAFCYAGDWSFYLNLATGDMSQCYKSWYHQNIFAHPERPIRFIPVGKHCGEHHCYNGHAFLTFGDIPSLDTPCYAQMRDRICVDGSHWLGKEMNALMSSRLYESNKRYSPVHQFFVDRANDSLRLASRCRNKLLSFIKGK